MPIFGGYIEPGFNVADIISGSVASGDVGAAVIFSGNIASGQIAWAHISSGAIRSGHIANAAVNSGNVSSGSIGPFHFTSPASLSGHIGSGAVIGQAGGGFFNVGSGTLSTNDLGSGAIVSGLVASGQIGRFHYINDQLITIVACEQAISGVIAVAWGSGGCFVVPAERGSGLRLPAIGVVAGNFASGAVVQVVTRGTVTTASSGAIVSGWLGKPLYVGSGGLITNQSGYNGGASSGAGIGGVAFASGLSGCLAQRIGISISGGIFVQVDTNVTSGLISGQLGQF